MEYPAGLAANLQTTWSKMPISHPALMIRSDVFQRIGLYSKRFEAAEDYDMIRRAADAGFGIDNVQEILLQKIETRDSISWKKRSAQLKSRLAIQWQYRDLTNMHCIAGALANVSHPHHAGYDYPTDQACWTRLKRDKVNGRSGGIRTRDPYPPRIVRYRAALRSD